MTFLKLPFLNKIRGIFLLVLLLFLMQGCSRKSKLLENKNILNYSLSGEISTLDPARSYDVISSSVIYQCYEQLYEYHYLKRPYTVKPLLAEKLPLIENNGTKYTIKIKKNIRYHDDPVFKGAPRYVKAQDFVTQIKRLAFISTKSNGAWIFDGKIKGFTRFRKEVGSDFKKFKTHFIEGITTPDDHTLVIELTAPNSRMLYYLSMAFVSPMPLEIVEAYDNLLQDRIVGTGPFRLKSWVLQSKLKIVKFKHYRDTFYPSQGDRVANAQGLLKDAGQKLPFLDGVNFHIIKESQTRWLNFITGKIDLLSKIPKDNYFSALNPSGEISEELKNKGIRLLVFPKLTYWWLSFNMRDPLVGKNLSLRLAIAHAVNVDSFIKTFTNNVNQKANSIFPPGIPGYLPQNELPYKFDLELARDYLKKAGYPKGHGLPEISYDVRGTSTNNRQEAEFIKMSLEKIGIKIRIVLNNFPTFLAKAKEGRLQFWQDGWSLDYPDGENVLQLLLKKNFPPSPNVTYFTDEKFEKLFKKMALLEDGPKKYEIMKEMEQIVHNKLPWIMQYYGRNYILIYDQVKNYRQSDIIFNYFKYIRLKNP